MNKWVSRFLIFSIIALYIAFALFSRYDNQTGVFVSGCLLFLSVVLFIRNNDKNLDE